MEQREMRSPLGRAIGLGSAKEGVEHWWRQRLTGLALVPLGLWFVASILAHVGADVEGVGVPGRHGRAASSGVSLDPDATLSTAASRA